MKVTSGKSDPRHAPPRAEGTAAGGVNYAGNTEVRIDYRVLQPYWLTDPNGNRGRVAFDGEDVTALPPHALARRGISRTFQNLQVFFNMTALENVMVGRHLKCDARAVPALFRFRHVVRGEVDELLDELPGDRLQRTGPAASSRNCSSYQSRNS